MDHGSSLTEACSSLTWGQLCHEMSCNPSRKPGSLQLKTTLSLHEAVLCSSAAVWDQQLYRASSHNKSDFSTDFLHHGTSLRIHGGLGHAAGSLCFEAVGSGCELVWPLQLQKYDSLDLVARPALRVLH